MKEAGTIEIHDAEGNVIYVCSLSKEEYDRLLQLIDKREFSFHRLLADALNNICVHLGG